MVASHTRMDHDERRDHLVTALVVIHPGVTRDHVTKLVVTHYPVKLGPPAEPALLAGPWHQSDTAAPGVTADGTDQDRRTVALAMASTLSPSDRAVRSIRTRPPSSFSATT